MQRPVGPPVLPSLHGQEGMVGAGPQAATSHGKGTQEPSTQAAPGGQPASGPQVGEGGGGTTMQPPGCSGTVQMTPGGHDTAPTQRSLGWQSWSDQQVCAHRPVQPLQVRFPSGEHGITWQAVMHHSSAAHSLLREQRDRIG